MAESGDEGVRLQVYLARCGIASRRTCETYIAAGRVSVNGTVVTKQGVKVFSGDTVDFDGKRVIPEKNYLYILLHKPEGYLCSNSDPQGRPLASDLFGECFSSRLFHVGRLDFKTSGLIIYTNDGKFAHTIAHPSSELEKEYLLEVDIPVKRSDLDDFARGVVVDGVSYRIQSYNILDDITVSIILIEGKNRELRNLFESRGYYIRKLKRIRIGPVTLGTLNPGDYRELTRKEREKLIQTASSSAAWRK